MQAGYQPAMSLGVLVALVAAAAVGIGAIVFLRHTRRNDPEQSAGHAGPSAPQRPGLPPLGTEQYPGGGRPAGPGAEGEAVPRPGDISPGPH